MGRVVNRLDDDWSDNFAYDDPLLSVNWSWDPPEWAENQLGVDVRESRRSKKKAVPAR
jgi:hypothetical protein